jgi:DNA modification methylase
VILLGDSLEVLATLDAESVDVVVTDPPYELAFMGRSWDASGISFRAETWAAMLRVAKPGAHLLAFGGTRTFHRIAVAIEDAGWQLRDTLSWLYGSGFPKSKNLDGGLGTALKPAWEPIILARKPLIGTVAANVEQYGTGALNIDAARLGDGTSPTANRRASARASGNAPMQERILGVVSAVEAEAQGRIGRRGSADVYMAERESEQLGRWPANVALSHSENCRQVGTKLGDAYNQALAVSGLSGITGYQKGDGRGASEPEIIAVWECEEGCAVRMLDEQSGETRSPKPYDYGGEPSGGGSSRFFFTATPDCLLCGLPRKHGIPSGWNPSSASDAGRSSATTQATDASSAHANALDVERTARAVSSVASLCDSCGTAIARSLAATRRDRSPDIDLGVVSISERKRQILRRSLVLLAGDAGSIDTTPTTDALNLWSGCVRAAIDATTSSAVPSEASVQRFRYESKASRSEREDGLDHRTRRNVNDGRDTAIDNPYQRGDTQRANTHPTVKPVDLMRWLVRLVTPRGGRVLDPFAGSGTTGIACVLEGFEFVGVEREPEHVEIAKARILAAKESAGTLKPEDVAELPGDVGPRQIGLFG